MPIDITPADTPRLLSKEIRQGLAENSEPFLLKAADLGSPRHRGFIAEVSPLRKGRIQ